MFQFVFHGEHFSFKLQAKREAREWAGAQQPQPFLPPRAALSAGCDGARLSAPKVFGALRLTRHHDFISQNYELDSRLYAGMTTHMES